MKQKIYSILPGFIFGVLVICFLVGFSVLAWTEPSAVPPGGNVPAPINVGNVDQWKTGRIGAYINSIDPNYGLTVGSGLKITNTGTQPSLYVEDQAADPTPFIIDASGNVGIGTPGPLSTVHIVGPSQGPGTVGMFKFATGSGGTASGVNMGAVAGAGSVGYAWIQADNTGVSSDRNLVLQNAGGNVGIGTTSPGTNRLEVVGGPIKATGGLIIETRTTNPGSPSPGQIWLCTDAAPYCDGI